MTVGVPVWEVPPENAKEAQRFKDTLLGRLAPISRAVQLPEAGEAVSLAVGCNYAQIAEFVDPYLSNCWNEKEKTVFYLRIQPERHPWRELESLLALQPGKRLVTPPKHLLNRNFLPEKKFLRLWCGGIAVDKAKYEFSGDWQIFFNGELVNRSSFWNDFAHFVQNAEEMADLVKEAIGFFWYNLSRVENPDAEIAVKAGKEKAQTQAITGFWQRMDVLVSSFLEMDCNDFAPLYEQLRKTAETFFLQALPDRSPRGMLAHAMTMPYFRKELKRILGDQAEKGEHKDGK